MSKSRGFTLVELLIAISIIAILTVVGVVVFGSAQRSLRDGRRRSDINAIAKAMEANYGSSGYQNLQSSWFAGGTIPQDPVFKQVIGSGQSTCNMSISNTTCKYCVRTTQGTQGVCFPGLSTVAVNQPSQGTSWIICANLETGGYFCRSNQQ